MIRVKKKRFFMFPSILESAAWIWDAMRRWDSAYFSAIRLAPSLPYSVMISGSSPTPII